MTAPQRATPKVCDPERIGRILSKIDAYWRTHPDWRLSQLVVNALELSAPNVFYAEDERLEAGIDRLAAAEESSTPDAN